MIDIGRCLLADRLRRVDMTQQELSELSGISKTAINDYIHNRKTMTLKTAKNIALALNCNMDDLYEFKRIGRRSR